MLASSKPEAIPGHNSGKYNSSFKRSSRLFLIFLFAQFDYFHFIHEFYHFFSH